MIKKSHAYLLALLFASLIITSCKSGNNVVNNGVVQKRKYTKGFYVKTLRSPKTVSDNWLMARQSHPLPVKKTPKPAKMQESEKVVNDEIPEKNPAKSKKKKKNDIDSRIPITVKSIFSEAAKITSEKMDKMNMGFRPKALQVVVQTQNETKIIPPRMEPLGIIGMISAIIGIFIAGILLGAAAVTLGIIGINKFAKHPGMFKGRGFAIVAIILGIIDIIGAIIYIALTI